MNIAGSVNMDLQKAVYPDAVDVVQGDQNTRCIEVSMYSGGTAWQIPSGATVAIRYRKPDMTGGYYDTMPDGSAAWSSHDNVITIQLAPQMLTVAGIVFVQLELIEGSKILGTFTMYVRVEANPAAGVTESEDYINWLQWMQSELDNQMKCALENGEFTGPAGSAGEPASLLSAVVEYQAGESGTVVPSGTWQADIPSVTQGNYLWTRTVYTFNTGAPVTQYSVSRFGKDSSGVKRVSVLLQASGWSSSAPYTQTIVVDTLTEEMTARAFPEAPAGTVDEKLSFDAEVARVRWCSRSGSSITFECPEEKPARDIPVNLELYYTDADAGGTDVPLLGFGGSSGDGGSGLSMELLWKNASPASEFAAQTVQLSSALSADDIVMIRAYSRNNGSIAVCAFGKMGEKSDLVAFVYFTTAASYPQSRTRQCIISESSVSFEDAYKKAINSKEAGTISNDLVIPVEILRIKGVSV